MGMFRKAYHVLDEAVPVTKRLSPVSDRNLAVDTIKKSQTKLVEEIKAAEKRVQQTTKTHNEEQAKRIPSKLHLFHHATSLGGVESLIEWRHMSDKTVETTLCRVSVGAESWEDLRDDIVQGCQALVADGRGTE